MSRYTGPVCRLCRREGTKLFLKGTKCFTEKCPVERRPYAPGQHGQSTARRRKASEYAKQLREKQKGKRIYGVPREQVSVRPAMDKAQRGAPLSWIAGDRDTYSGRVLERPGRHDIPIAAQEQ